MIYLVSLKVLLLVIVTAMGWCAGRLFKINPRDISSLLVYFIAPVVIFEAITSSPASFMYVQYSLGAWSCASLFALLAFYLAKTFWRDQRVHLFSFSGGTGNTGYFALPLTVSLFDSQHVAIAIFIILGVNLYEFTVGYWITARGQFDVRTCYQKISRLPILYAAAAGMIFKGSAIEVPAYISEFLILFQGAYSVLGMMVIGITLAQFLDLKIDWRFLCLSIGWKHLLIPCLGIFIFYYGLHVDAELMKVIVLMLSTPMAANIVVLANQLDVHPEIAATTVLFSTCLSLISVPLALALFLKF